MNNEEFDNYYEPIILEDEWYDGYHITKSGDRVELGLMEDEHIKNTIKYFGDKYDTLPLENELIRRRIIRQKSI